jgi:positive regulator of sigma E activity
MAYNREILRRITVFGLLGGVGMVLIYAILAEMLGTSDGVIFTAIVILLGGYFLHVLHRLTVQ